MKAVILAGGLGTRLKEFTKVLPKPLLPIGEKSVLEIQIDRLEKFGFREVFLATNYKSEIIEDFFKNKKTKIKITISKEVKRLGTVGPLSLLEHHLHEPFIVMNGDLLTLLDFNHMYKEALKFNSSLTVGVKEIVTPFRFGNIHSKDGYVTAIEEKPKIKSIILAGVYVFSPEIFNFIPKSEYFGMDDLINTMLLDKKPISTYHINEYWLDIGQIDDFKLAKKAYKKYFKE